MKILFDNNGFANLVQQPQYAINLQKLKQLVERRKITVVGCCTMLQELSGLAKIDTQPYLETLSEYEQLIHGQLLRLSNELVIAEGEQLKPIDFQSSLIKEESVQSVLSNLKDPSKADSVFLEASSLKENYAQIMENTQQAVLSELSLVNEPSNSVIAGYKDWFRSFDANIQDWFVHMFNVKSDFSVDQLQHVSAFLGYALTRIYERNTLNIKDRDNDLFDRAYFTDATVVDILVTNDGAFSRTAMRVPNRTFEVIKLDELALLIDK